MDIGAGGSRILQNAEWRCSQYANKNHFVNFTGATFVNHLHRQHLLIVNQVHLILTASNSQRK